MNNNINKKFILTFLFILIIPIQILDGHSTWLLFNLFKNQVSINQAHLIEFNPVVCNIIKYYGVQLGLILSKLTVIIIVIFCLFRSRNNSNLKNFYFYSSVLLFFIIISTVIVLNNFYQYYLNI